MGSREIYRVSVVADVENNVPAGLAQVRRQVSAYQRSQARAATRRGQASAAGSATGAGGAGPRIATPASAARQQRQQVMAQRLAVSMARQQAMLSTANHRRDQAGVRTQGAKVNLARQEVNLQRSQTAHTRQQIALQQTQEKIAARTAATARAGSLRTRAGRALGAVGGALGGIGRGIGRAVGGVASGIGSGISSMFGLPGIIAGAATGATVGAALGWPLKLAADLQSSTIAFTHFLGSGKAAEKMLADLGDLAENSPFDLPQMREAGQQLMGYKFSGEKIVPMLTTISDAAAAGGPGAEERIQSINRALGQIKAKGRVQGDELLQLQEAGINAADYMAKGWGITRESLLDYVQKGGVPAGRAIRHILEGMKADFGGLGEAQSKTIGGLWNRLKDFATNRLLTSWGQGLAAGVMPGLAEIGTWLDTHKTTTASWAKGLQEMGTSLSTSVVGGLREVMKAGERLFSGDAWAKATTFAEKMGLIKDAGADLLLGAKGEDGTRKGGLLTPVMDFFKGAPKQLGDAVTGIFGPMWNGFAEAALKKWDTFKTDALAAWQTFNTYATTKLNDLSDWFKSTFIDRIVAAIEGMNPLGKLAAFGEGLERFNDAVYSLMEKFIPGYKRPQYGVTGPGGAYPIGAGGAGPAAEAAIAKGMGFDGSKDFINLCLKFVDNVFGATGERYGTAWQAGQARATNVGGKLEDVPRGMVAYLRGDKSNGGAGHVMISMGEGKFLDPSSTGVKVTKPGDPNYDYYRGLYYGYGPHGTKAGTTPGAAPATPAPGTPGAGSPAAGTTMGGVPKEYAPGILSAASKYGLDPVMLARQLQMESGWNPNALGPVTKSGERARGIAQFMPKTGAAVAKQLGVSEGAFWADPNLQIMGAARHMSDLKTRYNGNMDLALSAYNAGPQRVFEAGNKVPNIPETQEYVRSITNGTGRAAGITLTIEAGAIVVQGVQQPEAAAQAVVDQLAAAVARTLGEVDSNMPNTVTVG